ncbi:F-box domain protein [Mycena kentingensis (nom. inval.)]|nr:F-box domain protein [Mycena kentingensis (nom. inval.)]
MSPWQEHLKRAKAFVKAQKHPQALKELEKALKVGGDKEPNVYECRAMVYEQQTKYKSALLDAKSAIQLAPTRWKPYKHGAQLFLRVNKPAEATRMADMALTRLSGKDAPLQRQELLALKAEADRACRQQMNHSAQLPVELLTVILEYVTSEWPHQQALPLQSVCKHWRSVIVRTPRLWSTLIIRRKSHIRAAKHWIERAKGMVHHLALGPLEGVDMSSLKLDLLRWNRLRVLILDSIDIVQLGFNPASLTGIEQLDVHHFKAVDHLLDVPVQRIKFDDCPVVWKQLAVSRPQLTSLEVISPHMWPRIEEIWSILELNPLLEVLAIELLPFPNFPTLSASPLTMPNLHTLRLTRTPWSGMFFQLVSMPSLRVARFANLHGTGFSYFVEQQPTLHHLSLHHALFPASEVVTLLRAAPDLHTLELTSLANQAQDVMSALADAEPLLCPALTTLDVSNCDVKTLPIIRILQKRNAAEGGAAARIRQITANACPNIDHQAIPWISQQLERFSCVYVDKKHAGWKR